MKTNSKWFANVCCSLDLESQYRSLRSQARSSSTELRMTLQAPRMVLARIRGHQVLRLEVVHQPSGKEKRRKRQTRQGLPAPRPRDPFHLQLGQPWAQGQLHLVLDTHITTTCRVDFSRRMHPPPSAVEQISRNGLNQQHSIRFSQHSNWLRRHVTEESRYLIRDDAQTRKLLTCMNASISVVLF